MVESQTITQNNAVVTTHIVPYYTESWVNLPYNVRILNGVVMIHVKDTIETPSKKLSYGRFIAGLSVLKIRFGLALTLFPYRLIGAEVNWLRNLIKVEDYKEFSRTLGIDVNVFDNWIFEEEPHVPLTAERVFRIAVYTTLVREYYPELKLPEALITGALLPRPKTTLPIVIATPAPRYYDLRAGNEGEPSTLDDKTDWMVNISIDPDITPMDNWHRADSPEQAEAASSPKPSKVKATAASETTKKKVAIPVLAKTPSKTKTASVSTRASKKSIKKNTF